MKAADVTDIRSATRLTAIFQFRKKILHLCMSACVKMGGPSSELH